MVAESRRAPRDVFCLGCKLKFTLAADDFDNQVKKGVIEEHKFENLDPHYRGSLAPYTCRDCPRCFNDKAESKSKSTVGRQMATIRIRRMELESLGQDRATATSTAVAEQMTSNEREYLAADQRDYYR